MPTSSDDRHIIAEIGGEPDEFSVFLAIYSPSLDPAEITGQLGVAPTHTHRKGEAAGPRSMPFKDSAWLYELRATAPSSVADTLSRVLDVVPPPGDTWATISESSRIQVRVAYHAETWNRDLVIPSDVAMRVASIGADIVVDVYVYDA